MNHQTDRDHASRRELHCPACQIELKPAHREQVEIDYCPLCQAIWLQRGELNTIVERSMLSSLSTLKDAPAPNEAAETGDPVSLGRGASHSQHDWFDFG